MKDSKQSHSKQSKKQQVGTHRLSKQSKQKLPDLPFAYDALEPAISARIMKLHHDKHHAGYVKKANAALEKLAAINHEPDQINYKHVLRDLSFNLNGHLLHSVFWQNMKPFSQDNQPDQQLANQLSQAFGSVGYFKQAFTQTAASVEGSGWAALLKNDQGELQLMQIENHNKLYLSGFELVLVVDVWEHAYYLDYENNRNQYLDQWWQVVNWQDVASRL
ncbi:MAG: superoxide dismutase [Candidatus Pacebacteria bacterium]|nr:superoxide dismutase [Candidatus Paceibacterota bacterium]